MAFTSPAPLQRSALQTCIASNRCKRRPRTGWRSARACASNDAGIAPPDEARQETQRISEAQHEDMKEMSGSKEADKADSEWRNLVFVLSSAEAGFLHNLRNNTESTQEANIDLGMRTTTTTIYPAGVQLLGIMLCWSVLSRAHSKGGAWAVLPTGALSRISTHGLHAPVSLQPIPKAAPTIILGGFGMHRIANGSNPVIDTATKLSAARPRGAVLDICTGLGYTAAGAAALDIVKRVVTIERDEAVVAVARANPWSNELFTNGIIARVVGDAVDVVERLPEAVFDTVVHDPPALALGGALYSADFYKKIFRVCKKGARLFHYIGNPSSRESGRLYKGIIRRLEDAGFVDVAVAEDAFGVVATAGGAMSTTGGREKAAARGRRSR